MKTSREIFAVFSAAFQFGVFSVFAQGNFQNLNFEQATIQTPPPNYTPSDAYNPISAMSALPGWIVMEDSTICTAVWSAPVALDETSVALVSGSSAPIQGNYSVQLTAYADAPPGYYSSSSISQTAVVPSGTQSIRFLITSPSNAGPFPAKPILSLNGTPINLSEISQTGGVLTMAGSIGAYAGTTADLRILCEATSCGGFLSENYFNLDNIVFSPNAIPEPATWTLLLCGAGLFGVMRQWRKP